MADTATVNRLRRKLGDTNRAFSDAELAVLLDEAAGDFTSALREGLWELWANSARLTDYTVGQSAEKKSQVFDHLEALIKSMGGAQSMQIRPLTYSGATSESEFGG